MKSKILILTLALGLVAAFSFAGPGQEESGSMTSADNMYGGTLTVLAQRQMGDPPSPAQDNCQVQAIDGWLAAVQEHLVLGNIKEYGGMGNGEFMFQFSDYIPWTYIAGHLIEDWEVTPEKATLYVRPGIEWYAGHVDWMESRELTAEDIAFDVNKFWHNPWGTRFDGVLAKDVYAADKYTVVCEFENFNNQFLYYIGFEDRSVYSPPELEDNSPEQWENQVGTGPFYVDSYTVGSNMTFKRNPNYWDKTVIDGVEYQMPFVDELILPIIPDAATMMSAFRTGKVDLHMQPQLGQWANYDSIGSDKVNMEAFSVGSGQSVGFNTQIEPFNDVRVRQALTIGTDRSVVAKVAKSGSLPVRFHPQSSSNPLSFIPDSELPEDVAQLYDYDPVLAEQMLADAGYPDGFKTNMYVRSVALDQDVAAVVKEQWEKIGVDATIDVMEPSAFAAIQYAVEYDGVVVPGSLDAANPIAVLSSEGKTGAYYNFAGWSNAEYDQIVTELEQETDEAKQFELIKEASLIMMREAPYLPLAPNASRVYWWKWAQNYHGEFSLSDGSVHEMLPYIWIDGEMKDEMGY